METAFAVAVVFVFACLGVFMLTIAWDVWRKP